MGNDIPRPTDIYLKSDDFKKFCAACHIDSSDELLEAYEKYGLIAPLYRIIRPKKYLQIIFEQRHKHVIEVPDRYGSLLNFELTDLDRWQHPVLPGFKKALNEGHPIEQAFNQGMTFIKQPSNERFRSWNRYNVKLEANINSHTIKKQDSMAVHYYSPWQMYLLEEANRNYTQKINVLLPKQRKRIFVSAEPRKLRLAEWQGHFNALWQYKFKENLVFAQAFETITGNILEGETAKKFHERCRDIAVTIAAMHSYESWIEFLRILCGLYFEYEKNERIKLKKCVKRDIRSTIDLIMQGAGKNYFELIDDVGMIIAATQFYNVPPLEKIFPEYERNLKREVLHEIETALNYYNSMVSYDLKLDSKAMDEIIEHAFSGGNETLLVSIVGIHQEYFDPSYFSEERMWSYVRSLSIAIESWTKHLSEKQSFEAAMHNLAGKDFEHSLNQLALSCGRQNRTDLRINNLADLKLFLKEISARETTAAKAWMAHILRAYIIRNYVAHHTKLESDLFGSSFIEIYNSLMFLVFYSWKIRGTLKSLLHHNS